MEIPRTGPPRAPVGRPKPRTALRFSDAVTRIRTIPVHAIVKQVYPRPVREGDELAMAIGRAIDGTLSRIGHEARLGRRLSGATARLYATELLDTALEESAIDLSPLERERTLLQIDRVVESFRRSEIFGLDRPRTRVILIDNSVGVYAQPDYWDGRSRIIEMKSYLAIPPPPDIALQLRLFQLAFPQFECTLFCLNRHSVPVDTARLCVPPPTAEESSETLRLAYSIAAEHGEPKVLEYMQGPFVPYSLAGGPAPEPMSAPEDPVRGP